MQKLQAQDIPALDVRNVTKTYVQWQRSGKDILKNLIKPGKKEVKALDDLSLRVRQGEFVAYAGANGAGKSTTIKLLSGILQPTSGSISVMGKNPAKKRIELMRQAGVLFGNRSELWWDFPVISSYEWKKTVWDIDDKTYNERLESAIKMLGLEDILQTFARELSLGQRMRADLGMLLLHDPQIIFLDEPTLGLDVLAKKQLIAYLKHINKVKNTTVVVTSHDMDDLNEMANRIILLSKGKVAFDGTFDELRLNRKDKENIHIIMENGDIPDIPFLQLIDNKNGHLVYSFDQKETSINQILYQLSKVKGIVDLEIKKAPIEDVIANLYRSWQ